MARWTKSATRQATWSKRAPNSFPSGKANARVLLTSESKSGLKLDTPIIGGRAGSTRSAVKTTSAEAGVHSGRLAELSRTEDALITRRVEMVQHVGEVHAEGDVIAVLSDITTAKTASATAAARSAATTTSATAESTSGQTTSLRQCPVIASPNRSKSEHAVNAHIDGYHPCHSEVIAGDKIGTLPRRDVRRKIA